MIYLVYIFIVLLLLFLIKFYLKSEDKTYRFELKKSDLIKNYKIEKNKINSIDHIYVLNLKKNKIKKENVKNMLKLKLKYKTNEDNMFYGFCGKDVKDSINELVNKKILDEHYKYSFPYKPLFFNIWKSYGCLGHYISFYQIFQNAKYNKLDYFMIVEDDAIFENELKNRLDNLMHFFINSEYDFISLGQSESFYHYNKKLINSENYQYKDSNIKYFDISKSVYLFQQTHTMIFKTSKLDKLINNYFPQTCPTDVMFGNLARRFKTDIRNSIFNQETKTNIVMKGLFCYPSLSKQREDNKSDIELDSFLDSFLNILPG